VASGSERGTASLAAECLNALGLAMLAISDQSVDVSIGDPEIQALLIGAGEALGVYAFGSSSLAFDLTPGTHRSKR
jgi:hypothetical protein